MCRYVWANWRILKVFLLLPSQKYIFTFCYGFFYRLYCIKTVWNKYWMIWKPGLFWSVIHYIKGDPKLCAHNHIDRALSKVVGKSGNLEGKWKKTRFFNLIKLKSLTNILCKTQIILFSLVVQFFYSNWWCNCL